MREPKARAGRPGAQAKILRAANCNPRMGDARVTAAGDRLPSAAITPEELTLLRPLTKALAELAANEGPISMGPVEAADDA